MDKKDYRKLASAGIEDFNSIQIKKIRRPRKGIPACAETRQRLEEVVLGPARERFKVAYLYWIAGYNAEEVAEATGFTVHAVKGILKRIRAEGRK